MFRGSRSARTWCRSRRVWIVLWTAAGSDGAERAGEYGDGVFDDTCAELFLLRLQTARRWRIRDFGYACAYLTTPPAAVGATTSAMVFDRGFRLPVVQQGSVTVEREIARGRGGERDVSDEY